MEVVIALDDPGYVITVFGEGGLMRADYDPSAETIQIELEPAERLDRDDVDIDGIVVGLHDGKPVLIDLIGVGPTVDTRRLRSSWP
jgi:hypothetical protein